MSNVSLFHPALFDQWSWVRICERMRINTITIIIQILLIVIPTNIVHSSLFQSTRDQYERYPYPTLESYESTLNVLQSPSHLIEMNHYIWKGRKNFCDGHKPFRILVAGGGTGVKTVCSSGVREYDSLVWHSNNNRYSLRRNSKIWMREKLSSFISISRNIRFESRKSVRKELE